MMTHSENVKARGCDMETKRKKRVIFWAVFFIVVIMLMVFRFSGPTHDAAKTIHLEKAGWNVPVLKGRMLPIQCSGLGRGGQ